MKVEDRARVFFFLSQILKTGAGAEECGLNFEFSRTSREYPGVHCHAPSASAPGLLFAVKETVKVRACELAFEIEKMERSHWLRSIYAQLRGIIAQRFSFVVGGLSSSPNSNNKIRCISLPAGDQLVPLLCYCCDARDRKIKAEGSASHREKKSSELHTSS